MISRHKITIIFVVGNTNYTYRQGNLYLNGKPVHTPFTDGRYDFLSKDQQIALDQFRYMENSGDEIMRGSLHLLVNSRNRHEVRVGGEDLQSGAEPMGKYSDYAYARYNPGRGADTYSEYNFKSAEELGYSPLETVFHEMRHQIDADKGVLPEKRRQSEQNAVSSQNYICRKEGKKDRIDYIWKKEHYKYNQEELRSSLEELMKLLEEEQSKRMNDWTKSLW